MYKMADEAKEMMKKRRGRKKDREHGNADAD